MEGFEKAFEKANQLTCDGVRFDQPNYDMLIVTEQNFLQALKMQAAAMAYYGTLYKQCERQLQESQRKYRFRYNEMYSDCSDSLARMCKKNNVKDIESFIQTKYEKQLQVMNENISELKKKRDSVYSFFEAIKAKGFILNNMTSLVTSNLLTPKSYIESNQEDDYQSQRIKMFRKLKQKD